jgi:hypothetical protein
MIIHCRSWLDAAERQAIFCSRVLRVHPQTKKR